MVMSELNIRQSMTEEFLSNVGIRYAPLHSTLQMAVACSAQAVASKIAVDQLVSAPLGTAVFFTSMKILEKRSDEIQSAIEVSDCKKLWDLQGWGGRFNGSMCSYYGA